MAWFQYTEGHILRQHDNPKDSIHGSEECRQGMVASIVAGGGAITGGERTHRVPQHADLESLECSNSKYG